MSGRIKLKTKWKRTELFDASAAIADRAANYANLGGRWVRFVQPTLRLANRLWWNKRRSSDGWVLIFANGEWGASISIMSRRARKAVAS
jgi:hypothetical protein